MTGVTCIVNPAAGLGDLLAGTQRSKVAVAWDGQVTQMPPLHYRIRPDGLRVMVPD